MKKLLLLLLLIPNLVIAETWVCAFKCYIATDKLCQSQFIKKGNNYIDEYNREFIHKESDNYLSLVSIAADKIGAVIFSYIINKTTGKFKKQALSAGADVEPREGSCEVVK